jgi:hypothetical protein
LVVVGLVVVGLVVVGLVVVGLVVVGLVVVGLVVAGWAVALQVVAGQAVVEVVDSTVEAVEVDSIGVVVAEVDCSIVAEEHTEVVHTGLAVEQPVVVARYIEEEHTEVGHTEQEVVEHMVAAGVEGHTEPVHKALVAVAAVGTWLLLPGLSKYRKYFSFHCLCYFWKERTIM